ncbi:hypothetical protein Bhyg_17883 [Pseudolycoriella hygida]|uniref:Uncharacterized protein n=1 Tax=Pseudolycoriella hygida TaxID=35572 RepID=A0A9Q0RW38_9DIPT
MLWNCKLLEYWTKPPEESTNDENLNEPDPMPVICPTKSRHIFSNLINNCLMHKLMSASSKSFDALEKLLLVLIKGEFLTIPSLNEQFVSLLREEWPEELLQNMSSLISKVSSKAATTSDDKAEFLFMEMLSDLSKDIIF